MSLYENLVCVRRLQQSLGWLLTPSAFVPETVWQPTVSFLLSGPERRVNLFWFI